MKNKNVILMTVVFFSAVSAALASAAFIPVPTWVKATKFVTGNPNPVATCSTVIAQCDVSGSRNCEVQVVLSSGATKSTIGYSANTCITPLRADDAIFYDPEEEDKDPLANVENYDDGNP